MKRLGHIAPYLLAGVLLAGAYAYLLRGEVQAARDLGAHVFPETFFLISRWATGAVPWWLPNERMGQPFAALLYTQAFYAPRIVTGLVFGPVLGPNVLHALHAAWAFVGWFFAARRLGLGRAFAFIAAAPFALSPFFVEFAQNLSFASVAAWSGWATWALLRVLRRPGLTSAAVLAVVLGAAFHAGAPEIWLQLTLFCGALALRRPRVRALGWSALGVLWAGGLGAVVALPAFELSRAWTLPGKATAGALEWSLSGAQLLSVAVPDGAVPLEPHYWGGPDQRFLFTVFIGASAVLLSLLGVMSRRARPVAVMLGLFTLLALGRHFAGSAALLSLPPFSLFRYPAKYFVGALWSLSLLAGFGARRAVALARKHREWPWWAGALGLSAGLVAASRLESARDGFHAGAPWLLLVVAALVVLRRRPWGLAAVVFLELLVAPVERWDRTPLAALRRPSALGPMLRQLQGRGRLSIHVDLDDVDREACGPWDEEDQLGSARDRLTALQYLFEDLRAVGGYGFRDPWRLSRALRHPGALAVAGVEHFLRETWAAAPAGATGVSLTPVSDLWIWHTAPALPRGWFTSEAVVADDEQAFEALSQGRDALARTVIVDQGEAHGGAHCTSPVFTEDLSPERVQQRVDACSEGVVILADAWDAGWTVTVDDRPAVPLRAWGFVRGVFVPAGVHRVEWRYQPRSARVGGLVTLGALLLLVLPLLRGRRRLRQSS